METGHLFGHIAHLLQILTEGRNDDLLRLFIVSELFLAENRQHLFRRQIGAEVGVDFLRLELDSAKVRNRLLYIDHSLCRSSASELYHQLACAVDCFLRITRIKSLLKNAGCIRAESDALRGFADIGAVEGCRLKEHSLYMIRDHGVLAAHDTGKSDFLFSVADHENVVIEFSLLIIERCEGFAVLCPADADFRACERVIVIGVHRLAVLEHDIIRDINEIVDWTDAAVAKAFLHPLRRRCDFYIRAYTGNIAAAQVRCLDGDLDEIGSFDGRILLHGYHRRGERLVKGRCRFSCDADHAVAVDTV